jgi:hypothetical protein
MWTLDPIRAAPRLDSHILSTRPSLELPLWLGWFPNHPWQSSQITALYSAGSGPEWSTASKAAHVRKMTGRETQSCELSELRRTPGLTERACLRLACESVSLHPTVICVVAASKTVGNESQLCRGGTTFLPPAIWNRFSVVIAMKTNATLVAVYFHVQLRQVTESEPLGWAHALLVTHCM